MDILKNSFKKNKKNVYNNNVKKTNSFNKIKEKQNSTEPKYTLFDKLSNLSSLKNNHILISIISS